VVRGQVCSNLVVLQGDLRADSGPVPGSQCHTKKPRATSVPREHADRRRPPFSLAWRVLGYAGCLFPYGSPEPNGLPSKITLSLLALRVWATIVSLITIVTCVCLFVLLNGSTRKVRSPAPGAHGKVGASSVVRLGRRVIEFLAGLTGLLVGLYHFGLNPAAVLAGLGLGESPSFSTTRCEWATF
jgi:hypothetical protein